jgi:Bardet-Biedl syndrome 2 protein
MFPVAQYETHENSIPFLTSIGNFTGNGHCFAAAASAKRLYVFDTSQQPDQARSYIKIGQKITCIYPCEYKEHDCLVVGTDNSIRLFDVGTNTQVFCTLIPDGASAVVVVQNHIFVGSNCAILGYTFAGEEDFWTVTGDVVTAMCEITWDDQKCLLVASQDLVIRLFSGEESIREKHVKVKVVILKAVAANRYAIAFENGSIVLIDGVSKVWDVPAGGQIVGMQLIDYSGCGKAEIAYATAEGVIGVLDPLLGNVTISQDTQLRLSGLHVIDFKGDGHLCLLVVGTNGSIRVFMPHRTDGLGVEAKREFNLKQAQPTLIKEKARLLLREYELTRDLAGPAGGRSAVVKPVVTGEYSLTPRPDLKCVELRIRSVPPTPIQGTVIECPETSGGDYVVFETNDPATPEQQILFNFPDDSTGTMIVNVFISGFCFAFTKQHEKFFGCMRVSRVTTNGYCEFPVVGRQFVDFVEKNFVLSPPDTPKQALSDTFSCCFQSLSGGEPIELSADQKRCRVACNKVETAVRIIAEYCDSASIVEFECRARFPAEIKALLQAAEEDGEMMDTQVVQRAEVAGLIANLKDLIVRIENAELIGQYQTLYDSVVECERLNEEIGREHMKRLANKPTTGSGNQKVNAMIQKFAELRKGGARNSLLQLARKELQSRNFQKLAYLLEHGHQVGAGGT